MAIIVTHSKVSTVPDGDDTSVVRPSDWNDDHVLVGLGTAAELDAGVPNGVATLDGTGKVPTSELPAAILGALNYQGTWNASTNTPTLTSSVGTKGYYYVVNVAGNTNLNGITDWQIGDWAVYNGTVWQKVDNTDAVTSVNGYTGTVVLNAADVGAVPYTGATGAVDLNAKSLVNVSNLGVNTTTVPTIKIRAVGDNNSGSRIAMRGYSSDANSSSIRVTKFRGTTGAPQAPLSGDSLGKFELAGYGTTSSEGYPQSSLEGVATENWGATARGAKAVVKVTPNTTTTQVTALTIDQDSKATFANTVTANGVLLTGNTGTVTSVAATAGTGISVSGSPITTSGTLTITNTAPDQTVALTAGTGISTSGTYPNFTITNTAPSSGGTVTSVTGTAPVVSSGGNTPAISIPAATGSVNGYLTSTDWTTFNNKQPAGSYLTAVTADAPLTGSGTSASHLSIPAASGSVNGYLSSTDWTTFNNKGSGSVTSVAALTLGTTGTDLSSTVANGTTTPVITLQVPTASATNRGALSAADWSTFNGKYSVGGALGTPSSGTVTNLTGTASININGTVGATTANTGAFTDLSSTGNTYLATTSSNKFGVGTASIANGKYQIGAGGEGGITYNVSNNRPWFANGLNVGAYNTTTSSLFVNTAAYTGGDATYNSGFGVDGSFNGGNDSFIRILGLGVRSAGFKGNLTFSTNSGTTITECMRIYGSTGVSIGNTTDPGATNLSVTGTGKFGTTVGVGAATPSTSGAGITFPATQSASTDANTLDDYEEGLHTATIACSVSGTVTLDGTFNKLAYTKIGRQVTVVGDLVVSSVLLPIGYFTISLPFATGTSGAASLRPSGSITPQNIVSANISDFVVNCTEGTAAFRVYLGDSPLLQITSAQQLKANTELFVSFTYFI